MGTNMETAVFKKEGTSSDKKGAVRGFVIVI